MMWTSWLPIIVSVILSEVSAAPRVDGGKTRDSEIANKILGKVVISWLLLSVKETGSLCWFDNCEF